MRSEKLTSASSGSNTHDHRPKGKVSNNRITSVHQTANPARQRIARERWLSFLTGVLLVATLLTTSVFNWLAYRRLAVQCCDGGADLSFFPTTTVGPANPTPATSSTSPSLAGYPEEWSIYRTEKYKFQIKYPKDLFLTEKVSAPVLPYPPRHVVNLYTARIVGPKKYPNQISVPFTIAVYDKPSSSTVKQWLSEAYTTDLARLDSRDINKSLARAYAGETGVVSYRKLQEGVAASHEVGAVIFTDILTYSTYFAGDTVPYVYEITLELPFEEEGGIAVPPDSAYAEMYKQLVSTFELLD